ncbi:hypothetical protein GCM10011492_30630 [Flexivirga endophytica]|uniref:DUF4192 domain-containing protein n=1 Tax=Flexivirga endophytica TaxID=1849103 RepID=A0A916TBW8_9MICO|nr:DUF4192 domain-containing protein [Flexivirga endophytica]GGB37740.1 hypothetical protein GCM10011492_30630 [Flexivirga endophytica]GHB45260.1 hypothetical protein GCM10008112_13020 [Flexivirga endophytica]
MSDKQLLIDNGRLVALMPHLLGARPEDVLVVMPLQKDDSRRPTMLCHVPDDQSVWVDEARKFQRYDGVGVAIVAFANHERAETSSSVVAQMLQNSGAHVWTRVATDGYTWVDLDSGDVGTVSQTDRDRIAVEFIHEGQARPYDSMAQLRASFEPSPSKDLAAAMNDAFHHTAMAGRDRRSLINEQRWMTHTIVNFVSTGRLPETSDAARLLCDVQVIPLRDHVCTEITHEHAAAHAALWKGIMTQSPEEARAPAASLTAFGLWLSGDGMQARLALEQVPGHYELANLIGLAVAAGVDPAGWLPPDPDSKVYVKRESADTPRTSRHRDVPPPSAGDDGPAPRR